MIFETWDYKKLNLKKVYIDIDYIVIVYALLMLSNII